MALLGASLPPGKTADGVDLSEFLTRRRPPREFAVGSNAIRTDRYKAIFGSGTLRGARVSEIVGELYDLASDPLETRTLWSTLPDIAVRLLEAYRSRVGGPYRRYLAARTEEQPDSAFAIASKDFGLIPAMPEELEARRWQKSDDWESFFLSAQPNARSLEVGFAIPNGVYAVTAALAGSAEVTLGEGSPIRLEGTSIRSSDKPPLDQLKVVEVATITVSDRRFAARLLPTGQSPFVIRYFGFSPVGRKPLTEADEEKLRALGYVR
jgi:hypothetical protein